LPITPEKVLSALKAQQNHAPGQSHA